MSNSNLDELNLIRAEGEGMVTTDLPTSEVPPLPLVDMFRARLDAASRELVEVQLPALRRAVVDKMQAHPVAMVGLALVAGAALGALMTKPTEERS